ncbi:MAG TPA: hypothetical protein VFS25_01455 [Chitinophaga sp.]|uniref:hypothetical protein n=1 Tax=Chitinophaga sp. TaxID=1869181 RepID=UPI002DBDAF8B|nr:hypothetical protein [Chitinophaga sp.]HEU4551464.1 hypothetical protein [Chitinophaga sp.]
MAVELEEVRLGNYYALGREVIRIAEHHYPILTALCTQLQPLRLQAPRLTKLGFNLVRPQDFNNWTKVCRGMPVFLKAAGNNRYILQLTGYEKVRLVEYIHELQNIWFWLFAEPLQKKEDEPQAPPGEGALANHARQPFFLTWDCQFLICTKPHVLWRISGNRPLFEYAGKKWGLEVVQGQAGSSLQNQAAAWLRMELCRLPAFAEKRVS